MGRYIAFKSNETKQTLLTYRAGSYPNSPGKFLEEALSLKYDDDVLYDIHTFRNETFSEINTEIDRVKAEISLELIKRDFENHNFLDLVETYEELLEIRGGLRTIVELFETHRNELLISYG